MGIQATKNQTTASDFYKWAEELKDQFGEMSTADVEAVAIQTKGATSQSIIHLTSMQVLREALTGHGWEALLKNLEK